MTLIRESGEADRDAVEEVRRASWRAAYAGIIGQAHIERAITRPRLTHSAPWRRTLVAVTDDERAVVGYASFGPERSVPAAARDQHSDAAELTPAGLAGDVGEIYAIYVAPDWWSTGAGRSLMAAALAALDGGGYQRAVLWVLAANNRARRFYERAGFTTDGESNVLAGLGGVLEVRYARPLPAFRAV